MRDKLFISSKTKLASYQEPKPVASKVNGSLQNRDIKPPVRPKSRRSIVHLYGNSAKEEKSPSSLGSILGQFASKPTIGSKLFDPNNRPQTYGTNNNDNADSNNNSDDHDSELGLPENITVADIIGGFGWFQLLVLLFSGLREAAVGYDAVVMSIILQPEERFLCADKLAPGYTLAAANSSMRANFNQSAQCFQAIDGKILTDPSGGEPIECQAWLFPPHIYGASLVVEWDLVCQRAWLVAFIESAYFFGLVTGNLVWGYYADRVGRRKAYLVAHLVALVAGSAAVFVPTIGLFTLCRFLAAFGSIGYNILYSIQVEIIGTKQRAFSTTMNHLGWGLGVICVPLVDHLFENYRYIIAVAPVLTLIM